MKIWKRITHELAVQILFVVQVSSFIVGVFSLGAELTRAMQISFLICGCCQLTFMLMPKLRPTGGEVARQFQRAVNGANYGAVFLIVTEEAVHTGISLPQWVDLKLDESKRAYNFTLDTGEVGRAWTTLRFVGVCGSKLHDLERQFADISEGIQQMFESHGIAITKEAYDAAHITPKEPTS